MQATLDSIDTLTESIHTFWFKPEKPLRYTAGQFIELTLPHPDPDSRGIKRWFTLSSSPSEDMLAITTKHSSVNTSSFKAYLLNLKPGHEVQISQPMGDFVLPLNDIRPIVCIAGGIGITPFRSMAKWIQDKGLTYHIDLLYAAETPGSFVFLDLFESIGISPQLTVTKADATWRGLVGHLSPNTILDQYPDTTKNIYYISGPEPMVESLTKGLIASNVPSHHIVSDYFPNYEPI